MKEVKFTAVMGEIVEKMAHGGVFLNVGGEQPNTMTIGWGWLGYCWNKPVFAVVVRPQRHSYEMLRRAGEFTVSIPGENPMRKELAFAGSKSGRDVNKFEGHGLTAVPAQRVGAPIIAECSLHVECRTLLTQAMTPEQMDSLMAAAVYPQSDFHIMFFGEVVACYEG